ncbi:MAG: hypothetical protein ABIX01_01205 [Chitinophagaceae bacterium]
MNRIIFVAIVLVFNITASIAQQNIPGRKEVMAQPNVVVDYTKVLSAAVSIDSTTHIPNGTAWHNYFKATIGSVGTGTITYHWVITNNGPQAPPLVIPGTMTLSGTGTDYIYLQKSSGRGPISYKLGLQILSPTQLTSNFCGYN